MEYFKIENLEKAVNFLNLEDSSDKLYFLNEITRILGLGNNIDNVYNKVYSKLPNSINVLNVEDGDLLKRTILELIPLNDFNFVYIFWANNIPANLILVKDLFENWESFFYATSDEAVLIFIPSHSKIFLLTHYGEMKYN